ncbi:NAD-dependent epimerase/dehydratase family protein [uncultured Methanomethylovorans sp.]|uniref:NAD-dependent epimerase/dehydratase family protein n=1 Tax=uncultured Methanomethylovorans sp. TaxID=183759 RepID=UPI002AA5FB6B|nr:NAD-dependent epimerase/dehydratase family protein [uncultured Methanomethylovorans sp.]
MKKVLITGGLGFIGSYLARECVNRGFDVTIVSKSEDKIENISDIKDLVKLIILDVADITDEVIGYDVIFHLAGSTDNYSIIENKPYKDIQLNCVSTISLLEAIRKHNPKARLFFASTFFVNGNVEKLPVDENTPCNPLGLYGATRLAGEHFCHIYHNIFDLDIVIARFCNVFGAKEKGNDKKKAGFNYLIKQAVEGNQINIYDNGNFFRDYIYVTDVVSACLTIAEKGSTNKTYYVGLSEFVKFKNLIDIIVQHTGVRAEAVNPPDFHNRVGIKNFVCDNSELKRLGWKPEITIEEGIEKTIQYYKELRYQMGQ